MCTALMYNEGPGKKEEDAARSVLAAMLRALLPSPAHVHISRRTGLLPAWTHQCLRVNWWLGQPVPRALLPESTACRERKTSAVRVRVASPR